MLADARALRELLLANQELRVQNEAHAEEAPAGVARKLRGLRIRPIDAQTARAGNRVRLGYERIRVSTWLEPAGDFIF